MLHYENNYVNYSEFLTIDEQFLTSIQLDAQNGVFKAPKKFSARYKHLAYERSVFAIQAFSVTKNDEIDERLVCSIMPYTESALVRSSYFKTKENYLVSGCGNDKAFRAISPSTDQLIRIQFEGDDILSDFIHAFRIGDKFGKLYLVKASGSVGLYYFDEISAVYKNMVSDTLDLPIQKFDVLMKQGFVKTYRSFVSSPSAQRQKILDFIEDMPDERLAEIIDEVTGGVWSMMEASYAGQSITLAKTTKLSARLSLVCTPSLSYEAPKTLAIYVGEFGKDSFGYATCDGCGMVSSGYIATILNNAGENITEKDACSIHIQARKNATKGIFSTVKTGSIEEIIKNIKNSDVVYLPMTNEAIKVIQSKEYKNKVVIFGNKEDSIDMFVDLTTLKEIHSLEHWNSNLNIMKFATVDNGPCHMSTQILAPMMEAEGFAETLDKLFKAAIDEIIDSVPAGVRIEDAVKASYPVNFIGQMTPGFISSDQKMNESVCSNKARSIQNLLNSFKVPVSGMTLVCIPDFANIIGKSLIRKGEVFIAGHGEERCTVVRHPRASANEHYKAVVLTRKEIMRRIKELDCSKGMKNVFKSFFSSLIANVVVTPSADDSFVKKLGGSDYDGDLLTIIFDEDINRLFDQYEEFGVDFGEPDVSIKLIDFNLTNIIEKPIESAATSTNLDIGVVANKNTTLMSALYLLKTQPDSLDAAMFCSLLLGKYDYMDHFSEKYVRKFDKECLIDSAAIRSFVKDIKKCGLNDLDNMINVLSDLNVSMSSIMGMTIDANKNGAIVKMPLKRIGEQAKSGILEGCKLSVTKSSVVNTKAVKCSVEYALTPNGPITESSYIMSDVMVRVRDANLLYAVEKLKKELSKSENAKTANPFVKKDDINLFLSHISTIRNEKAQSKEQLDRAGVYGGSVLSNIKPYYINAARLATQDISDEERLLRAKAVSNFKDTTVFNGSYLDYDYELISYARNNAVNLPMDKLYSYDNSYVATGTRLDFVNGVAGNFYIGSKFTGSLDVIEENGEAYVTAPLDHLITKVIDNKFIVKTKDKVAMNGQIYSDSIVKRLNAIQSSKKDDERFVIVSDVKHGDILIKVDKDNNAYYVINLSFYTTGNNRQSKLLNCREVSIDAIYGSANKFAILCIRIGESVDIDGLNLEDMCNKNIRSKVMSPTYKRIIK